MTPVEQILEAVSKALSLWETYLKTKAERYDLHLKQKRQNALNKAEDAFDTVRDIFEYIYENVPIPKGKVRGYNNLKKAYYKLKKKFDDYD